MSMAIESERQLTVPEGALGRVAWTERDRGLPDVLLLRLRLDDEEEEYTLRVTPELAVELIEFLQRGTHAWLDLEPKKPSRMTPAADNPPGGIRPRWAEAAFMRT
jgi:hypothetical protein